MAGNPLAKYLPWVKKNAVYLYLGFGVLTYLKRYKNQTNTYKIVYSKNDFERRYHLDKLEEFIEK